MTLLELLHKRSQWEPTRVAYRFLSDDGAELDAWDYSTLNARSRSVGATLDQLHMKGHPVAILCPPRTRWSSDKSGQCTEALYPAGGEGAQHRLGRVARLQTYGGNFDVA
jgi:acyl-CoA synthetase (AMP-forming)/AMP-acid ligase II